MLSTSEITFVTANLLKEFEILSLGCPNIDKVLKGGFRSNVLNEIAGDSGSGKTQICLVLSLLVQLPKKCGGLDKATVYICTEKVFPIKRLHELNRWFQQKYGTTKNFLDNIFIQHIPDYEILMKALHIHLPNLLRIKDIGLIVIDSIAGIFRSDNLEVSYVNRSKQLNEIALILRQFGAKYCCVIICVNQVTENLNSGKREPCLGLTWSNSVISRFFISRCYPLSQRIFQSLAKEAHCWLITLKTGLGEFFPLCL